MIWTVHTVTALLIRHHFIRNVSCNFLMLHCMYRDPKNKNKKVKFSWQELSLLWSTLCLRQACYTFRIMTYEICNKPDANVRMIRVGKLLRKCIRWTLHILTLRLEMARLLGSSSIRSYSVGFNNSVQTRPLDMNKPSSSMVLTWSVTPVTPPWSVNVMLSYNIKGTDDLNDKWI